MTPYILRFGGLVLVLIAVAVGVLIGRIIEAAAVGAVLFAIWTYVSRLVADTDHRPSPASDGQLD